MLHLSGSKQGIWQERLYHASIYCVATLVISGLAIGLKGSLTDTHYRRSVLSFISDMTTPQLHIKSTLTLRCCQVCCRTRTRGAEISHFLLRVSNIFEGATSSNSDVDSCIIIRNLLEIYFQHVMGTYKCHTGDLVETHRISPPPVRLPIQDTV